MVTCGQHPMSMMPLAPLNHFIVGLTPSVAATTTATTTTTTPVAKPKLAFSIDSIVGEGGGGGGGGANARNVSDTLRVRSPLPKIARRSESPDIDVHVHSPPLPTQLEHVAISRQPLELRNSLIYCRRGTSVDRCSSSGRDSVSPGRSRSRSPLASSVNVNVNAKHGRLYSARSRSSSPAQTPTGYREAVPSTSPPPHGTAGAGPILVPGLPAGLVRPLPLQPPNLSLMPPNAGQSVTAATAAAGQHSPPIHRVPQSVVLPPGSQRPPLTTGPTIGAPLPPTLPPGAPPHGMPPHLLAAQFHMAAMLAHHQQQQQQHHPAGPPPPHLAPGHPMGMFPHQIPHPHFGGPHLIRDSYPLYPWLISRHGRIFTQRFPGNFLLQPFRKPKRVRTAFSPTQLLKLEHAFEGNHYVVGAERKQLAQGLSLTETQVKVWFQNRRTKHKRMQQEGDSSDTKSNKDSTAGDNDGKNDNSQHSFEDQDDEEIAEEDEEIDDEDELIDMDDYSTVMDVEEQQRMHEQFQMQMQQHLQQQQQQHQQHQQEQLDRVQHATATPQLLQQQQQQQQFMQHQLYLHHQQQQHQQQQQKQQKQQQP